MRPDTSRRDVEEVEALLRTVVQHEGNDSENEKIMSVVVDDKGLPILSGFELHSFNGCGC